MIKVSRSRNKIVEPQFLPKKGTNKFVFLSWTVVGIEKQIRSFVFWENLRVYNFVSRSTDLYHDNAVDKTRLLSCEVCIHVFFCPRDFYGMKGRKKTWMKTYNVLMPFCLRQLLTTLLLLVALRCLHPQILAKKTCLLS